MQFGRRAFLLGGTVAAAGAAWPLREPLAQAASGRAVAPAEAERHRMAEAAQAFIRAYDVPGFSFAVAVEGALVHEQAFGVADRRSEEPLAPAHRFRIASISKPITAVAIMQLAEAGKLALADRVLGPGGVLGTAYGPVAPGSPLSAVTVEHLLTHRAGGWTNDASDPMFKNGALGHADLNAKTLRERPLRDEPGTRFAYSNFGYCLLGRVIEKATGRPYASHVRDSVLAPAGATGLAIAGNTLADRQPMEVRYHPGGKDDPYRYNVARMDSHGGWVATAADIVRFAAAVDRPAPTALLRPQSVAAMTAPPEGSERYAKGWRISPGGNWWHGGHLPGTTGRMVRARTGVCFAGLLNTRHRGDDLDRDFDKALWRMARTVKAWRA